MHIGTCVPGVLMDGHILIYCQVDGEVELLNKKVASVIKERDTASAKRDALKKECGKLTDERDMIQRDLDSVTQLKDSLDAKLDEVLKARDAATVKLDLLQVSPRIERTCFASYFFSCLDRSVTTSALP